MIVGLIVFLGVGILFLVLGWVLWKQQKISLVNGWHTRNVKKEDVPAYTRLMGFALIAIGAGCAITGIVAVLLEQPLGWLALALGFIAGFVLIFRAQRKYNEGRLLS